MFVLFTFASQKRNRGCVAKSKGLYTFSSLYLDVICTNKVIHFARSILQWYSKKLFALIYFLIVPTLWLSGFFSITQGQNFHNSTHNSRKFSITQMFGKNLCHCIPTIVILNKIGQKLKECTIKYTTTSSTGSKN